MQHSQVVTLLFHILAHTFNKPPMNVADQKRGVPGYNDGTYGASVAYREHGVRVGQETEPQN